MKLIEVYESYLEKRWREVSDQLGPVPKGPGRIAKLRLNCMAQHAAKPVLDALQSLDAEDYELLVRGLCTLPPPLTLCFSFRNGKSRK